MKNQFLLVVAFSLMTFCIHAQKNQLYAEFNYNTFMHDNLKSFQEEFVADVTVVQLVKNDEFPANIGFTVGYTVNEIHTSFFVSYTSTGGKVSYSDYSGIIRLTQAVSGITVGGEYLVDLDKKNTIKGDFNLGLRGFLTFSNLEIESTSGLINTLEESSMGFRAIDFGVGVRAIYEYPVAFFSLRLSLGFDAVLGGKYVFKENPEFHLENNFGKPVKNGWSGLRSGLGISIPL